MISINTSRKPFFSLLLLSISFFYLTPTYAGQNEHGRSYEHEHHKGLPFKQLQDQIDALQAQVDQLSLNPTSDPIEVSVNCPGDSINDVLAQYAGIAAPLIVTINGNCDETVNFQRDNVTLRGNTNSDGLTISTTAIPIIGANTGLSNIVLENLTVESNGTGWGVLCNNSTITLNNVSILSIGIGVVSVNGGRCQVNGSTIEGTGTANGNGVLVANHASSQLGSTTIRNFQSGINVNSNSDVFIGDFTGTPTTIENTGIGITVYNSSNATLANAMISNNGTGIEVFPNATLAINAILVSIGGGFINGNTGTGIIFHQNSSATFFAGAFQVQNNGGFGIQCENNVAFTGTLPTLSGNNGGGAQHDNCPLP